MGGVTGRVTVTPVILTGGQSRRFGRPKTDIVIDSERLLDRTIRVARQALGVEPLVIGDDSRPGNGPLGGIETALLRVDGPVLVLACDMPLLTEALLRRLAERPGDVDVVVPRANGRLHPLCARWSPTSGPAVTAAIDAQRLSVTRLLDDLSTDIVDVVDSRALSNVNTPEELLAALDEMAR